MGIEYDLGTIDPDLEFKEFAEIKKKKKKKRKKAKDLDRYRLRIEKLGGAGSGHHGHAGRKGKIGGSRPRAGLAPGDYPKGDYDFGTAPGAQGQKAIFESIYQSGKKDENDYVGGSNAVKSYETKEGKLPPWYPDTPKMTGDNREDTEYLVKKAMESVPNSTVREIEDVIQNAHNDEINILYRDKEEKNIEIYEAMKPSIKKEKGGTTPEDWPDIEDQAW